MHKLEKPVLPVWLVVVELAEVLNVLRSLRDYLLPTYLFRRHLLLLFVQAGDQTDVRVKHQRWVLVGPLFLTWLRSEFRYLAHHRLLCCLSHYLPRLAIVYQQRVEEALSQQVNYGQEDVHFQLRRLVRVLNVAVYLERSGVQPHRRAKEILEVPENVAKLLILHSRERQLDALVQKLD